MASPTARERLLDAAEKEFFHRGIAVTGVDRVANEAGVAIATLYQQFGSKEGLLREVLSRRLTTWTDHWDTAVEVAATPDDRLLAIFDAVDAFRSSAGSTQWCCFLATASERPSPTGDRADPVHDLVEEDTRRVVRRLEQLARDAGFADPQHTAAMVLLLYNGVLSSFLRGSPAAPARTARHIAATALQHLTPGSAPA